MRVTCPPSRIGYLNRDLSLVSPPRLSREKIPGAEAIKLHGSELDFAYSALQLCMNAPTTFGRLVRKAAGVQLYFPKFLGLGDFCSDHIPGRRLAPFPISVACQHKNRNMKKRSRKNSTVCFRGSLRPYLMQFCSQPKSATLRSTNFGRTQAISIFCVVPRKKYGSVSTKRLSKKSGNLF